MKGQTVQRTNGQTAQRMKGGQISRRENISIEKSGSSQPKPRRGFSESPMENGVERGIGSSIEMEALTGYERRNGQISRRENISIEKSGSFHPKPRRGFSESPTGNGVERGIGSSIEMEALTGYEKMNGESKVVNSMKTDVSSDESSFSK